MLISREREATTSYIWKFQINYIASAVGSLESNTTRLHVVLGWTYFHQNEINRNHFDFLKNRRRRKNWLNKKIKNVPCGARKWFGSCSWRCGPCSGQGRFQRRAARASTRKLCRLRSSQIHPRRHWLSCSLRCLPPRERLRWRPRGSCPSNLARNARKVEGSAARSS